jgi:hypothetical protein
MKHIPPLNKYNYNYVNNMLDKFCLQGLCFISIAFLILLISCSKPGNPVEQPTPPTLTITPGLTITIPFNSSTTFSWTTNGTGVTVNGIASPSGTFTTPLLQANATYTVTSYSSQYVSNGLSTTAKVLVNVLPDPDTVSVYCSGMDGSSVVYWKDTVQYSLATVPNTNGRGYGVALLNNDVYVVGYALSTAAYWKNSVQVDVADGRVVTEAKTITISGNDVYIGGRDVSAGGNLAVYWKNGVRSILSSSSALSNVNSIAISGSDVYAAGFIGDTAVYWVNGVKTNLPHTGYSLATSIVLSGTDIFIGGTDNGAAVYWKNGIKTILPSTAPALASSMIISGTDIHIAGVENGSNATYWKNGVKTVLSTTASAGNSIALFGDDVYICGWYLSNAVYWKNGIRKTLRSYSAGGLIEATGIVVKRK